MHYKLGVKNQCVIAKRTSKIMKYEKDVKYSNEKLYMCLLFF